MGAVSVLLLLLFASTVSSYTDESINLLVRSSSTALRRRYCIELARLPNARGVNITGFEWRTPYFASSLVNACNITDLQTALPSSFARNSMLVLYEHGCKMTEHAWNVEQQFGKQMSLMILTNRTDMRYSLTYNNTAMPVSILTLIFLQSDFVKMKDAYRNLDKVEFSIDFPPRLTRRFRPAILLMFLLVLIVLVCGNQWALDEFKKKVKGQPSTRTRPISRVNSTAPLDDSAAPSTISKQDGTETKETTEEEEEPAVIPMTYCLIVVILCFAIGWLLLIYYFPKVMIYILQAMFCLGAFSSLTSCLDRFTFVLPKLRRYQLPSHTCRQPYACHCASWNVATLFAVAVSLALVLTWYFYRHAEWSWILQDILGAAICITVTSIYRLGNMRVITFILLGFFLYDIFFVFITPYIPIFQQSTRPPNINTALPSSTASPSSSNGTSGNTQMVIRKPALNPSVMEQVALGFGTNGEVVPLLFALPMFIPEYEIDPCALARKSMLGFGDVILPGILLTFCKIFDTASGNRWPIYYVQSVISYFVGLSLTHAALYLMNTAQPALLYLVPCLLLSTIITGLCRRELKELFTGERIRTFLEGQPVQRATSSLLEGVDNPNGLPLSEEVPSNETRVIINDR